MLTKRSVGFAALLFLAAPASAAAQSNTSCNNPNALGVSRTVEIDTSSGPGFGFQHYKVHDFLQDKEIVLTFDDGPLANRTDAVLQALAKHCTRATFFSIGKMALGYPEIIRRVKAQGHTVGTHTWSHANLRRKKSFEEVVEEIERGNSAVRRAVGSAIAPFFRFPQLQDSPESLEYLRGRGIAVFSTDMDSFDFKIRSTDRLVSSVMANVNRRGKGILLLHDIQPVTANAIDRLLAELKKGGFKIVHLTGKDELATLPEWDRAIEPDVKGLPPPGEQAKTSSIVRTVDPNAPRSPSVEQEPAARANMIVTPAAGVLNVERQGGSAASSVPVSDDVRQPAVLATEEPTMSLPARSGTVDRPSSGGDEGPWWQFWRR